MRNNHTHINITCCCACGNQQLSGAFKTTILQTVIHFTFSFSSSSSFCIVRSLQYFIPIWHAYQWNFPSAIGCIHIILFCSMAVLCYAANLLTYQNTPKIGMYSLKATMHVKNKRLQKILVSNSFFCFGGRKILTILNCCFVCSVWDCNNFPSYKSSTFRFWFHFYYGNIAPASSSFSVHKLHYA